MKIHGVLNYCRTFNCVQNKSLNYVRKIGRVLFTEKYKSNAAVFIFSRQISLWSSKKTTEWNKAVSDAEKLVGYPTSLMGLRCFLSDEISNVARQMRKLVGSKHPLLETTRGLVYNDNQTLQTRGLIVLLVCKSAGPHTEAEKDIDNRQRTLAEITEMIHTACLIHKGVVDLANYNNQSDDIIEDMQSGNKMATLTGDFLLANASTELASLENTHVVENISRAIGNCMEAEFTKLRSSPLNVTFKDWLDQTYLSYGSLLAHSCQSALLLVGHKQSYQDAAFEFGKNLAVTRQLYEDLNKFLTPESEETESSIFSTAPAVLYLGNNSSSLSEESLRDPEEQKKIFKSIQNSEELLQCKDCCRQYGDKAKQSLQIFENSASRDALFRIINATTVL